MTRAGRRAKECIKMEHAHGRSIGPGIGARLRRIDRDRRPSGRSISDLRFPRRIDRYPGTDEPWSRAQARCQGDRRRAAYDADEAARSTASSSWRAKLTSISTASRCRPYARRNEHHPARVTEPYGRRARRGQRPQAKPPPPAGCRRAQPRRHRHRGHRADHGPVSHGGTGHSVVPAWRANLLVERRELLALPNNILIRRRLAATARLIRMANLTPTAEVDRPES